MYSLRDENTKKCAEIVASWPEWKRNYKITSTSESEGEMDKQASSMIGVGPPKNRVALSPMKHIKRLLEDSGESQSQFLEWMNWTADDLNCICFGSHMIDVDKAAALSSHFNTSIDFWYNMQDNFLMSLGCTDE